MNKLFLALITSFGFYASASTVSIVDSGTYYDHDFFKGMAWENTQEIPGNFIDDDDNGKVDDVNGWNFAENMDRVFFQEHISKVPKDTFDLFLTVDKIQSKSATKKEEEEFNEMIKNLSNREKRQLANRLNFYGQFSHGTHCAGTVALGNDLAKIQTARVFPDQAPPQFHQDVLSPLGFWDWIDPRVWIYNLIAAANSQQFLNVAKYLDNTGSDVANMSLGVPLKMIVGSIIGIFGKPSDEKLSKEVHRAYQRFETKGQEWLAASPNTLFVVASGNDGSDNDMFPTFPSNMKADNMISVAATKGDFELASFSNWGKESVDIAAPGVSIVSAVPAPDSDMVLPMSGTSMAAPIVTMVASRIKDVNSDLTPLQMKQILMQTVDKRSWLEGKVVSEGILNEERAVRTAEIYDGVMSIEEAVHQAFMEMPFIEEPITVPTDVSQSISPLSPDARDLVNSLVF